MIPRTLAEWTIEIIVTLLTSGIHESEEFDFKQMLPHPKDEVGKLRLREACCAFANSGGGFVVFGVHDDRRQPAPDRLIGLEAALDFPMLFGDYPRLCTPSVQWTFRNPPLGLRNGSVVQIVQIPPSPKSPHACGDIDRGWRFTKRTNKGTESMSIEEVRGMFLAFYEKRLRLQLLEAELAAIEESASQAFVNQPETIESSYSLITFGTQTIESIVVETYPLTANSSGLLASLIKLRQQVNIANNKARIFFATVALPLSEKGTMVRAHNEFMRVACTKIVELTREARSYLKPLLQG